MTDLNSVIGRYMSDLEASPATRRQRRWAFEDLVAFVATRFDTPSPAADLVLREDVLHAWLERPGESGHAPSVASARARASAARALTRYAVENRLLVPVAEGPELRLPAPPPADRDRPAGALLLAAAAGPAPWGVPTSIWARFSAHVHLLAATGATERELALVTLAALGPQNRSIRVPELGVVELGDRAARSLTRWLALRAATVESLQGSDPQTLWIRLHPGKDHRTGVIAPAGLTISPRGLRLSFGTVRDVLGSTDPRLASVTVRDVRALGLPEGVHDAPARPAQGP
ncbi:hypothetical protein [Cellulomonas soli]|uniref:Core-binding (CB) domain-containing protein n=1 Tax=Cellulomonas soli TaxID=931535 RepID=A0A512PAJ3_9CELL|nr:hypothetical protein [Cellulomonas soli]NYI60703.1 hypothetical protein [Cellulomonas soli]GEP68218.1 hypothetical protein CSO01_09330 [Cellulomonas soli]